MAATPLPQAGGIGGSMMEGMPPPPGTDLTGICFRDQLWLNSFPLDRNLVFDYFALSPFYDWTCNNEHIRMRSIHPLDVSQLSKMTGIEYMLNEVMEPHLFVIRKQKRDGPDKVTPMLTYYVLDGSIYQAPQLSSVFASRMCPYSYEVISLALGIGRILLPSYQACPSFSITTCKVRALYYISKSFTVAASKLEKIGYDTEGDSVKPETKAGAENIDFKEVMRVDHILTTLQRKLSPAPPPPPFPEGFAAPSSDTAETQDGQAQNGHTDPIIDQGAAKRLKIEK